MTIKNALQSKMKHLPTVNSHVHVECALPIVMLRHGTWHMAHSTGDSDNE